MRPTIIKTANALAHEQHGAGVLLPQGQLSELTAEVIDLMFNDWLLAKFKSNLERLDRFESSERIAKDLIALLRCAESCQSR